MKVILNQTLPKVGKEGQVVNVADGFARNFLFPRGLATVADKARLAALARKSAKASEELEKTKSSAQSLAEKLAGQTIRVVGKTAKGSPKLFGAVTAADIADSIKNDLGVEIEKRSVALLHPIKRIGVYQVLIDLHRDADATIKLEVSDEEGNLGMEPVTTAQPQSGELVEKVADKPVEIETAAEASPESPAETPTAE